MTIASLILKNANVITMDPTRPTAELVAISGDRISLVAGNSALESVRGPETRIIDCQGKTVVPGFIDAHCHVFSFIRKLLTVDLSNKSIRSISDIKEAIGREAQKTPPSRWIEGTGYSEFYLAEKRHPTRGELDETAPNHPVLITHRSLHACVLNSLALAKAGITRETPEPPGAGIERDLTTGEPNGLLFEMVGYVRSKVMPPLSGEELSKGLSLANRHYLSLGITSLQEATVTNNLRMWRTFKQFKDSDKLKSRIYLMFGAEAMGQFQKEGMAAGYGDEQLRLGGIKIVLTRTGGQLHPPEDNLYQQVIDAQKNGFPVAIHAVQEEAVEAAISALENAQRQSPRPELRHRIEHCSECPSSLVKRLKSLNTVVATQPPFLYYSGERYLAQVPAHKIPYLYPFRSLIDAGLVVAASSDSPVVPDNPLVGMYSAITRKAESGQELGPAERLSPAQALAMYTVNAAYASSEEDIKGSISAGKLADMVVLSDDPLKCPADAIKDIKVEMTVLGGEVVWEG